MGENHLAPVPTAVYGMNLLACAIAFTLLQKQILTLHGKKSLLAAALGNNAKGKISPLCYLLAIGFAFIQPIVSGALFVAVALIWLLPDPRIERAVLRQEEPH